MALPTIPTPRAPSQAAGKTQLHQEATWCLLMGKTPDPLLGDQEGMQHTTVYCLSIPTTRRILADPEGGSPGPLQAMQQTRSNAREALF